MKTKRFLAAALATVALTACDNSSKPEATNPVAEKTDAVVSNVADTVFTNAKVYTVNKAQPWAEAVAVKGGKIVFVGSSADAASYIGDGTTTTDLNGQMLLPGFVSGHDHLIAANWMGFGVQLYEAKSKEDYHKLIKEYAEANPDEEFVLGIGWNPEIYGGYPTAKDLDALVPNRPAILLEFTVHDAWLNTKAMELGKVTKDTPDPSPGVSYWQRDKDGNPTGIAIEVSWMPAYVESGAWNPDKMIPEIQQESYGIASSTGITTVLNAGIVMPTMLSTENMWGDYAKALEYLHGLEQKGELAIRTFTMPFYKTPAFDVEPFAAKAAEFKKKYHSDMLSSFAIKIHPEGNYSSKTSFMLEPYKGTDEVGDAMIKPDRVKEVVLAANKLGVDVITHCDGSATTRGMIDAILASKAAGNTNARNSIHHMFFSHPDDQKRIIENDLLVNATPMFYADIWGQKELVANLITDKMRDEQFGMYPAIKRAGNKVSLSADVPGGPIETVGPLISIETAITQRAATEDSSTWFPPGREGLTLEQAIETVTIDAAYFVRMEDKIGSIEVGKYADLVILDENLFDVEPKAISDVKVVGTIMNGKYTYHSGDALDEEHMMKKGIYDAMSNPH